MRLGEIKNILDKIVENDKITIKSISIFSGQGYKILNIYNLIKGLKILKNQNWNSWDDEIVEELNNMVSETTTEIQIPVSKYNQLVQYVNNLNTKFPIFYQMLNSFVEPQDKHVINIKLPNQIFTLDDLTEINKNLNLLFKKINIDADFQFVGFDIGSSWYKILITGGVLTYSFFIGVLQIGQELFKMRAEYYKSETEKQHYMASLRDNEEYNDESFKKYIEKFIEIKLDAEISQIINEIDIKNNNENEIKIKLLKSSKEIANQLEKGIEFHLSLNPPNYVNETNNGSFEINYEKIRKIQEKQNTQKKLQISQKLIKINEEQ